MPEGEVLGGVAGAGRIGGMRAPQPCVGMMVCRRRVPAGMPGVAVVVTVVGIPLSIARTVRGRSSLQLRRSRAVSREQKATLRL
jgi:hypothetical protein